MRLDEFSTLLEKLNLPIRYRAFEENQVPQLPYLVYFTDVPEIEHADNRMLHKIDTVTVELVTERKDLSLETSLESLLDESKLFFDILSDIYIDTERLYVKSYTVSLY